MHIGRSWHRLCPQWTKDFPNRNLELLKVRGVDFRIGKRVAWKMEDPTASRDGIIEISRSLVRPLKNGAAEPFHPRIAIEDDCQSPAVPNVYLLISTQTS